MHRLLSPPYSLMNMYVERYQQSVDRVREQREPLPCSPLRSILVRLPLYVGNGGCSLNAHTFKMRNGFHNIGGFKKERNPNNPILKEQRHFRAVSAADKTFPKQRDPDNPSFCGWQEPSDQVKCSSSKVGRVSRISARVSVGLREKRRQSALHKNVPGEIIRGSNRS